MAQELTNVRLVIRAEEGEDKEPWLDLYGDGSRMITMFQLRKVAVGYVFKRAENPTWPDIEPLLDKLTQAEAPVEERLAALREFQRGFRLWRASDAAAAAAAQQQAGPPQERRD